MSAENQQLEEKKKILGDEFGAIYYHGLNEWCNLWLTWKQYESLFGHGSERVELLNKAGGSFFYRVNMHFFEAVVLAVCRISDPSKTLGKTNLTVHLFQQHMDCDDKSKKMEELLNIVHENTQFARDWRNRRISHNDYQLKLGKAEPLAEATRNAMNQAIASIHDVFKYISLTFMDSDLMNEVVDHFNNEKVTLERLYHGVLVNEERLEKIKDGIYEPNELPAWLTD